MKFYKFIMQVLFICTSVRQICCSCQLCVSAWC